MTPGRVGPAGLLAVLDVGAAAAEGRPLVAGVTQVDHDFGARYDRKLTKNKTNFLSKLPTAISRVINICDICCVLCNTKIIKSHREQVLFSQHFIFLITYEWVQ